MTELGTLREGLRNITTNKDGIVQKEVLCDISIVAVIHKYTI